MSDSSTEERHGQTGCQQPAADGESRSLGSPRVDGPHTLGDQRPAPSEPFLPGSSLAAAEALPGSDETLAETTDADVLRLRLQARQLTELLRVRYEDLERREALLSKQLAGADRDARAMRLQLDECVAELREREQQFDERQAALDEQDRQLAAAGALLQQRERALTEQTGQLAIEAAEWSEKATDLAAREAALEPLREQLLAAARVQADETRQAAIAERDELLAAAAKAAEQARAALQDELHVLRQNHETSIRAARAAQQRLEEQRLQIEADASTIERRTEEIEEQARQTFEQARAAGAQEAKRQAAIDRAAWEQAMRLALQRADEELESRRETLGLEWAEKSSTLQAEAESLAAQQAGLAEAQRLIELGHAAMADREAAAVQSIEARREAAEAIVRLALARLDDRQQCIEFRAAEVEARWEELRRQSAQPSAEEEARRQDLEQLASAVGHRERRIQEAEAWLEHGQNEVQRLRADLQADRERSEAQTRLQRRRLAESERRLAAEISEKRRSLERQNEELDLRRGSLEQLQQELIDLHRETLELRLSTEELWTQLAGDVPPAALSHALGQSRARLDDQHRMTLQKINAGRAEVEQLRIELAVTRAQLEHDTQELEQWAQRRSQELDQQAAALAAREGELDEQERAASEAREGWIRERLELEQELRATRDQLRKATASRFGRRSGIAGPRVHAAGV
ncbi:MAG TPA: hypothetical protein VHV55_22840 [Pirellulales bacterium]|jgi:hypothetical protein|nr:hypothetical protein [Pirellulales bacterium]